MQILSRPQRLAIARIYSRTLQPSDTPSWSGYRSFRSFVLSTIGCDGAVIVPFSGMFLCVERDGYTHS